MLGSSMVERISLASLTGMRSSNQDREANLLASLAPSLRHLAKLSPVE